MSENKSRREFISQSGKMVTACALFGATGSVAYAADSAKPTCETGKPMSITAKHYYLDNVLLEAGFNVDGGVATSTRTELKTLINAAFQVDKEGNISTARVLGLRRLAIDDAKWRRAMDALSDSLQVHTSKAFVRVYRRDTAGEYQLINLDVAKV